MSLFVSILCLLTIKKTPSKGYTCLQLHSTPATNRWPPSLLIQQPLQWFVPLSCLRHPLFVLILHLADFKFPARRNKRRDLQVMGSRVCCFLGVSPRSIELQPPNALMSDNPFCGQKVIDTISSKNSEMQNATEALTKSLVIIDLDPATAKAAIAILGPFLSAFSFLFILRIIMSWYPKLPVEKFPYFIAYAPTEPLLIPTRRLIPPLGGVDVTPVVWFGLISFLNEILVGPQGLLVLLSQQIS